MTRGLYLATCGIPEAYMEVPAICMRLCRLPLQMPGPCRHERGITCDAAIRRSTAGRIKAYCYMDACSLPDRCGDYVLLVVCLNMSLATAAVAWLQRSSRSHRWHMACMAAYAVNAAGMLPVSGICHMAVNINPLDTCLIKGTSVVIIRLSVALCCICRGFARVPRR